MKRIVFLAVFMIMAMISVHAKSYPFDMTHSYEVQIVRVAQQGTKFLKVWGIAGSPNKAMDRAMQDAVAACILPVWQETTSPERYLHLLQTRMLTTSTKSFLIPSSKKASL